VSAELAEILVVYLAAAATPGPNVLLVMRTAVESRRAALAAAGGVVAGAAVLASAATFGLGPVLTAAGSAVVMRVVGGGYLIWFGVRLIRHARAPLGLARAGALRRSFLRGLLTNLSNPKAALFFGVVLTALLPPGPPTWRSAAAVGLIVVSSAGWHTLVAVAFSTERARAGYVRARVPLNRVAGALLVLFGVVVLVVR
jgi:threonine efflux protein